MMNRYRNNHFFFHNQDLHLLQIKNIFVMNVFFIFKSNFTTFMVQSILMVYLLENII
jgi:hypothetical protein